MRICDRLAALSHLFCLDVVIDDHIRASKLRASLRAFVSLDPDPVAVIEWLDTMFAFLDISQLASIVYAVIDPANEQASDPATKKPLAGRETR